MALARNDRNRAGTALPGVNPVLGINAKGEAVPNRGCRRQIRFHAQRPRRFLL